MSSILREQSWFRATAGCAAALWLVLSLTACEAPLAGGGSPLLLTKRGDPVWSDAPPAVEVTLGSKRVLPAGEPAPLD